jgi:membrane protease YdiL (CAAX protease family)
LPDPALPSEPVVVELVEEKPARRGKPVLAWIGIMAFVAFAMLWSRLGRTADAGRAGEDPAGVLEVLQSRYLVGASNLLGHKDQWIEQAKFLDSGSPERRLRYVILLGELAGPNEALDHLHQLNRDLRLGRIALNPEQEAIVTALGRLYRDYSHGRLRAPSVDADERHELHDELGWFGELALAPAGSPDEGARQTVLEGARRTTIVILGAVGFFGLLSLTGFTGLVVMFALAASGRISSGLGPASDSGAIYAETFALWLALFLALNVIVALMPTHEHHIALAGLASSVSLLVLIWPVLRGIPWTMVRQEIGLTWGRAGLLEPLLGPVCYALGLPLLAVGLILTLVLIGFTQRVVLAGNFTGDFGGPLPAHPIILYVAEAGWWQRLQVLLLATIAAPIVEETMFRGVFYRHLRDATGRWGLVASVAVSSLIVSFFFAIVHPQGLLAVPALMALATGLALTREWRGSLVPGMVMHGLNNGLLLCLFMLAIE